MAYELRPHGSKSVAMVRAGEEAHLYEWCRDNGFITIGWFGHPPTSMEGWSLGRLESEFRAKYPYDGEHGEPGAYRTKSSQTRGLTNVADFLFNIPIGRRVMIASPAGGATVLLGTVVGGYEYHDDWDISQRAEPYCHFKAVEWLGEFKRADLVVAAALPWTDQQTVWWVEDLAAIRDLEAAAGGENGAAPGTAGGFETEKADVSATSSTSLEALAVLTPLTDKAEIADAYVQFVGRLKSGVDPIRKGLGWPGGWGEFDVYWHPTERVWCVLEPEFAGSRYWCCFGPDDPATPNDLSIGCEINFAYEGVNRRIAGAFLRDAEGRVYVAHSGKVGGGHEGVGKSAFLKYIDSPVRVAVAWPDGQTTEMLIIGMLDADGFVGNVATFVSEVASFKRDVRDGTTAERDLPQALDEDHDADLDDYFPESLLGTASFEQKTRRIEIRLAHGPVVHALRDAVEAAGLLAKKNNRIDLAAVTLSGDLLTVFEVKTAVDWGSVYGAIGQLMYHGKTGQHSPKRLVAVLPGGGPADLDARLEAIGLGVVRYSYAEGRPVFHGLGESLE